MLSETEREELDLMLARRLFVKHFAFHVTRPWSDGTFVHVCRGCEWQNKSPCEFEQWSLDVFEQYGEDPPAKGGRRPQPAHASNSRTPDEESKPVSGL